ncbi:twitch domain-containing radical SAM protein [Rhizobium sp. SG2393]|uniref:twitch domain-containing radical SAM protein n=1 Tax=Rhizobium sp. SG2393 TaxID=3276279 RepID=UPI00366E7693
MSGERAPSSLCLVPWIHAHVDAQGFRGLCCMDMARRGEAVRRRDESFEAFWNGAPMRAVRRQMLSGALPERCRLCRGDGNRSQSLKDQIAERWPGREPEIIAATDADGATTLRPFTFDYRTSICNLKCRTCGPLSSSSAEAEARQQDAIAAVETEGRSWDAAYRRFRATSVDAARGELLAAVKVGAVRQLYWAGGEPLADETHWSVMLALVESGQADSVDVAYNTNLTLLSHRQRSVETLWPAFRSVHVQASVDGLNAAGTYIRSGFDDAVFRANVETVRALAARFPTIRLTLDVTVTSVGLLHLGPLLEFALEAGIEVTGKFMVPRPVNAYLAVEALPDDVRRQWSEHWMDVILRRDENNRLGALYDLLRHGLTLPGRLDPGWEAAAVEAIAAFETARQDAGGLRRLMAVDSRLAAFPFPRDTARAEDAPRI